MHISLVSNGADVRPLLEALVEEGSATTFALLEQVNPRRPEIDVDAWRDRQVKLLTALASAHEAGLLETRPRELGEVTESFELTSRGHDLLSTESTRPFARLTERPADSPPPPVARRAGRWVLTGDASVRSV